MEAWKLYKSTRIKSVHKRKGNCEMAILSAKYGLINAEKIIEPYNQIMDNQRAQELEPQIKEKIAQYEKIIFYKGGAGKPYKKCIEKICKELAIQYISFGYANQGDINLLQQYTEVTD